MWSPNAAMESSTDTDITGSAVYTTPMALRLPEILILHEDDPNRAALEALVASGALPAGLALSRVLVEPPRE